MTMRRTRHKLEPQCDQACEQGTVHQTRTTLRRDTTNKQTNKLSCGSFHSAHESSVDVLVGFHMLRVCGNINLVVVLVALHSCHHSTRCHLFPHIHFSPVCEVLADFVDSHTAKTGLLRCCLYTPRRLQ